MQDLGFSSSDRNRFLGKATDSGIKLFFKWFGIALTGFINFIKVLVGSALGN